MFPWASGKTHLGFLGLQSSRFYKQRGRGYLSSCLGEEAVVFGTVLSGRHSDTTVQASFPCITTLPVVAENLRSNRQIVEHMLAYNADLHRFQHTPLGQIQRWLGRPESPLFDTIIVYQKIGTGDREARPWNIIGEQAGVEYPISVEVEPCGNEIAYRITFY